MLREEPFVVLAPSGMKVPSAHAVLARESFIRLDRNVYAGQLIDDISASLAYDQGNFTNSMGSSRLQLWSLGDWACPCFLTGRRRGRKDYRFRSIRSRHRSFKRRTGLLWKRASLRARLISAFAEQARLALPLKGQRTSKPKATRSKLNL